jgi:hypothetical protein
MDGWIDLLYAVGDEVLKPPAVFSKSFYIQLLRYEHNLSAACMISVCISIVNELK